MAWTVWDGQKTVTTDNYQEMKAAVARRLGGGSSPSGGSQGSAPSGGSSSKGRSGSSSGVWKMDEGTFNQYENEYANWQKTGKYSEDAGSWFNQSARDTWAAIRDSKGNGGKSALIDGQYVAMDADTYGRYDKEYQSWEKTGKYSDDAASWFKQDERDAFAALRDYDYEVSVGIRPDQETQKLLNSLNPEVMQAAADEWKKSWYWWMDDPEDVARMNRGEMPTYWTRQYDMNDPLERYLYQNNLPPTYKLNTLYANAAEKHAENEEKKYSTAQGIVDSVVSFQNTYAQLAQDFMAASASKLQETGEHALVGDDREEVLLSLFKTGKYDGILDYFADSDKDPETAYEYASSAKKKEPLENQAIYDAAYQAILKGQMPDDEFFSVYSEGDFGKYLSGKLSFDGGNIQAYAGELSRYVKETSRAVYQTAGEAHLSDSILELDNMPEKVMSPEEATEIRTQIAAIDAKIAEIETKGTAMTDSMYQSAQPTDEELAAAYQESMVTGESADMILLRMQKEASEEYHGAFIKADAEIDTLRMQKSQLEASLAPTIIAEKYGEIPSAADFADKSHMIGRKEEWSDEQTDAYFDIQTSRGLLTTNPYFASQYMTDIEHDVFNYITNENGIDAALQYYSDLSPVLNQRNYADKESQAARMAEDYPVLNSIGSSVFGQFLSAVEGLNAEISGGLYELSGGKSGRELEYQDPRLSQSYRREKLRASVRANIEETTGDAWRGVAYDMAISVSDNAVRMLVFKGMGGLGVALSSASMGGQIMGSTINEYMMKGASNKEALLMGALAGGCEALGEAVDMSMLMKLSDPAALAKGAIKGGKLLTPARRIKSYLKKNAITETGSEIVTEMATYVADLLVMRDRAEVLDIYNAAKAEGKTNGQAFFAVIGKIAADVGMAGLGGLISGLLLGGGNLALETSSIGKSGGARFGQRMSAGARTLTDNINANAALQESLTKAYQVALEDGTALDTSARLRIMDDIHDLGLDETATEEMNQLADKFASSPAALISPKGMAALAKFRDAVHNAASSIKIIDAEAQARKTKARSQLGKLYDSVINYQREASAALQAGDLAGHTKAMEKLREAMSAYNRATETAKAENDASVLREGIKQKDEADKAKVAAQILGSMVGEEAEHQLNGLTATVGDAMNALMGLPMDGTAQAARALRGGASASDAMSMLLNSSAQGSTQPTSDSIIDQTTKGEAADGSVYGAVDGSRGQRPEERSDGVYDGESGRNDGDTPQRIDPGGLRGFAAGHQSGNAQDTGARQVAAVDRWDASSAESQIAGVVADYNAAHKRGSPKLTDGDITASDTPSNEKVRSALESANKFLGGQKPLLFNIREGMRGLFGWAESGREYVRDTGDDLVAFYYGHERAHNRSVIIDAGRSVLDMFGGKNSSMFQRYLDKFNEHPRTNDDRNKLATEFLCDVYGAYVYAKTTGKSVASKMGITDDEAIVFFNAFDDVMSAKAILDADEMMGNMELSEHDMDSDISETRRMYVDYNDSEARAAARDAKHEEMMDSGTFLELTDEDMDAFSKYFPDLRSIKKEERSQQLKDAKRGLPSALRTMLHDILIDAGYKAEFDVNGDVVVAGIYQEFADHAVSHDPKRFPTQVKSAALKKAKEVFAKSEYLYSAVHDEHSSTPKDEVDHWDYFYTPVVYGEYEGGVLISVRQMTVNFGNEYQVYGWNQTKQNSLGRLAVSQKGPLPVDSSAVSTNTMPETAENVKQSTENSQSDFSTHDLGASDDSAPRTMRVMQEAATEYANGTSVTDYWEKHRDHWTPENTKVMLQLRGMMIRNGQSVGGTLSQQEIDRLTENSGRWRQIPRIIQGITSPGRLFEKLGAWRSGKVASDIAENYAEGKEYRRVFFDYGQNQMANKALWMREEGKKVRAAYDGGGIRVSTLAQLLGEGLVTKDEVANALFDRNHMIVQKDDGVFVFDKRGQLTAMSDGQQSVIFDDDYRNRKREAEKEIMAVHADPKLTEREKSSAIADIERRAKTNVPRTSNPITVERHGNNAVVKDFMGVALAEIQDGKQVDAEHVERVTEALRGFYERAYDAQNTVLMENGYKPLGHIKGYFPHQGRTATGIESFIKMLNGGDETLPTAISGQTASFKPGKPWAAHVLERMGTYTEFDAIRGFNKYLGAAGDVIYSTPVIQRIRQLEKQLRNTAAPGDATNAALVSWLRNYGNIFANKKSGLDRGAEDELGRGLYSVSNKLTGLISASAIGVNPRSALSNVISFLNSVPTLEGKQIVPALTDTVRNMLSGKENSDGFADTIPFLVNRQSRYKPIQTSTLGEIKQTGSDVLYWMFETMDRITSESTARAKYAELREKGFTDEQAAQKTSEYCLDIYADRTKGANATLFNSKLLKPFMQFQMEVLNQASHFHDIRQQGIGEQIDKLMLENGGTLDGIDLSEVGKQIKAGGAKDVGRIIAYLILMSLWGGFARWAWGNDQTWNPAGMAADAVRDYKDGGLTEAIMGVGETVLNQAPIISTFGSGRIPVAAGMENVVTGIKNVLDGNADSAGGNLLKGALSFTPGGGQINRTIQGAQAVSMGGNYTGKGKLRYPIEDAGDVTRALILGPSAAAPQDYQWGEDVLSDSRTEAYQQAKEAGVEEFDMYDFLLNGYDTQNGQTEVLSFAAAVQSQNAKRAREHEKPLPKKEINIIAELLGIDYDGNIKSAGKDAAEAEKGLIEAQKSNLDTQLKKGKITQEKHDAGMKEVDERTKAVDELLEILMGA